MSAEADPRASASASVGAVVLVGGRARRMGGAAKHLLDLGGSTPWERTLAALARSGIAPVVAVGPAHTGEERIGSAPADAVIRVREDPPFGGPVAALAAALTPAALDDAAEILLLAGDLVDPEAVVARLARSSASGADAARAEAGPGVPADPVTASPVDAVVFRAAGQPQWLAGRYRTAAVRAALAALGEVDGASCRALLGGLPIRWIPDEDGITADIDTPDDLERARADAAGAARPEEPR